jgi:hypothetical protein
MTLSVIPGKIVMTCIPLQAGREIDDNEDESIRARGR